MNCISYALRERKVELYTFYFSIFIGIAMTVIFLAQNLILSLNAYLSKFSILLDFDLSISVI